VDRSELELSSVASVFTRRGSTTTGKCTSTLASEIFRTGCRQKSYRKNDELFTGWMLLSYRKAVTASSVRDTFPANNVTDENPRTFWVARQNRPGESLRSISVAHTSESDSGELRRLQVGLYGRTRLSSHASVERIAEAVSGRRSAISRENERDRPNAYIELSTPMRARFVRYEHIHVGAANLAISDIRVFGNGDGRPPAAPSA
jgi:hypothetical protein